VSGDLTQYGLILIEQTSLQLRCNLRLLLYRADAGSLLLLKAGKLLPKDKKNSLCFNKTKQYIYFIFTLTTFFVKLSIIRPSLQNLE